MRGFSNRNDPALGRDRGGATEEVEAHATSVQPTAAVAAGAKRGLAERLVLAGVCLNVRVERGEPRLQL
jgi:hypothetical protein